MRHTVRPFVTAYKFRSSKSRKSPLWDVNELEKASPKPSLVNPSDIAPAAIAHDGGYSAALRAADAAFGRKVAEPAMTSTPSNVPAGRILPCLIEESQAQVVPELEAPKKVRRAAKTARITKPVVIEPTKTAPRRSQAVAKIPLEEPTTALAQDASLDPAARLERSAIQRRWVRKTELKPGEKWKRRLCRAAR